MGFFINNQIIKDRNKKLNSYLNAHTKFAQVCSFLKKEKTLKVIITLNYKQLL